MNDKELVALAALDYVEDNSIVGLGTGFNVCPVVEDINEKPVCLQVELGHISLPSSVKEALTKRMEGWQLNAFQQSYNHKINNGISLFKKNLLGKK